MTATLYLYAFFAGFAFGYGFGFVAGRATRRIRRMHGKPLHHRAVEINGAYPDVRMLVELPCTSLVFFPNNPKRRITLC